jgi:SAM-dependent methyltransferase
MRPASQAVEKMINVKDNPTLRQKSEASASTGNLSEFRQNDEHILSFLAQFLTDAFVAEAAERACRPREECRHLLETFTNEAKTYWPMLQQHIHQGSRVLEVGSGLGFLSLWLTEIGVNVTSLEPAAGPFDIFGSLASIISELSNGPQANVLPIGVESINSAGLGKFDVIFSFNVLEHIDDLESAFAAMAKALSPSGIMLHSCPNYAFPYEPHLGIPLIPFAPQWTHCVFSTRIAAQQQVWESLNFITARRLRNLAKKNFLEVELLPGQMTAQIERLAIDAVFAERHFRGPMGVLIRSTLWTARKMGVLKVLRNAPPDFLTPMTAIVRKQNRQG